MFCLGIGNIWQIRIQEPTSTCERSFIIAPGMMSWWWFQVRNIVFIYIIALHFKDYNLVTSQYGAFFFFFISIPYSMVIETKPKMWGFSRSALLFKKKLGREELHEFVTLLDIVVRIDWNNFACPMSNCGSSVGMWLTHGKE